MTQFEIHETLNANMSEEDAKANKIVEDEIGGEILFNISTSFRLSLLFWSQSTNFFFLPTSFYRNLTYLVFNKLHILIDKLNFLTCRCTEGNHRRWEGCCKNA